ncbi:3'-5' exonuclease [Aliivibrio fischeri]|uniref:3'-5' exonuclease n=1 Tax=Aliivibrio fischeri TaxID=668 RepID=UPI0012DA6355|nr:3'-5' exonuclease [Aliivibrio fischeri]MUK41402.1 3'-5' exonuclease [Aliivibrio fischeri]
MPDKSLKNKNIITHMMDLFSNRHPLHRLEEQRQALIEQNLTLPNYLSRFLKSPYPGPKENSSDMAFTVVDFETSGLNPKTDHIVSIGWVHIIDGVIKLSSAQHHIINEPTSISAENKREEREHTARSLHHILPEQQKMGISLEEAMEYFFSNLPSNILVVHGATIEQRFLEQFFLSLQLPNLPIIWLDTLRIEQNTIQQNRYQRDFRLFSLRRQYKLPDYPAHHALVDAISTAELFLAQKKRLFNQAIAPIGFLYQKSQ